MWKVIFLALPLFIFVVLRISGRNPSQISSYAERHLEFERVMDENPWMKIYYAVYGVAVVAGVFYAISKNINVAEMLGFWGFMGVFVVLMVPIFIYKLQQLGRG
jgi:hypothetical protein